MADDNRQKWHGNTTVFMGDRETSIDKMLAAMHLPSLKEQMESEANKDPFILARKKAVARARAILAEAYSDRQKLLAQAGEDGQRQYELAMAEAESLRKSSLEGYHAMQAELEKAIANRKDAEFIREKARLLQDNAQVDGQNEGLHQAAIDTQILQHSLGQQLSKLLQGIAKDFASIKNRWREDLTELVRLAIQEIVKNTLEKQHAKAMQALILNAMSLLENRHTVAVRVPIDDAKPVSELFQIARERVPELQNWQVSADPSLTGCDFIIETASGSVDARRICFQDLLNDILQHLFLPETPLDRSVEIAALDLSERAINKIINLAPPLPEPEPSPEIEPEIEATPALEASPTDAQTVALTDTNQALEEPVALATENLNAEVTNNLAETPPEVEFSQDANEAESEVVQAEQEEQVELGELDKQGQEDTGLMQEQEQTENLEAEVGDNAENTAEANNFAVADQDLYLDLQLDDADAEELATQKAEREIALAEEAKIRKEQALAQAKAKTEATEAKADLPEPRSFVSRSPSRLALENELFPDEDPPPTPSIVAP